MEPDLYEILILQTLHSAIALSILLKWLQTLLHCPAVTHFLNPPPFPVLFFFSSPSAMSMCSLTVLCVYPVPPSSCWAHWAEACRQYSTYWPITCSLNRKKSEKTNHQTKRLPIRSRIPSFISHRWLACDWHITNLLIRRVNHSNMHALMVPSGSIGGLVFCLSRTLQNVNCRVRNWARNIWSLLITTLPAELSWATYPHLFIHPSIHSFMPPFYMISITEWKCHLLWLMDG